MHEYVSEGNRDHVRGALKNLIYDNSRTTEYIWGNYLYAKEHIPDLSEEFKVDDFNYEITDNTEEWDKDYFHNSCASLDTNFNEKRYKNVLKVRDYLREQGDPDFKYIG